MSIETLADVACDFPPECFHCEEPLPPTSKATVAGDSVEVVCPSCGCTTPFPMVAKISRVQS